jgi:hypothetical protein
MNPTWLEVIASVMISLWLVGMGAAYTFGGFIHTLLAVGIVAIILRLGLRRPEK